MRAKSSGSSFLPKKALCNDHWASEIVNQGFLSSPSTRPARPSPAARPSEPARKSRRAVRCVMVVLPFRGARSLVDDGVEDADFLPVFFVFLDELLVAFVVLVLVVSCLVLEDQVQGDVKVAVVDRAVEVLAANASGEVNRAVVLGQVLVTGLDEFLLGLGGIVLEGEVDHVADLTFAGVPGPLRLLFRQGPGLLGTVSQPGEQHHPQDQATRQDQPHDLHSQKNSLANRDVTMQLVYPP